MSYFLYPAPCLAWSQGLEGVGFRVDRRDDKERQKLGRGERGGRRQTAILGERQEAVCELMHWRVLDRLRCRSQPGRLAACDGRKTK